MSATVVYFLLEGLAFGIGPLRAEFQQYPAVYRPAGSNIGLRLMGRQALAYFIEWLVVGIVIGAIYRP